MVTCCFKVILTISLVLSIWDFATDIMAAVDFKHTVDNYQSRADDMIRDISGDADSNFKADSEWFTTLKAEYDGLYDWERENIFCDISLIQSDPSALTEQGTHILYASYIFVGLSVIAIAAGYGALFCLCKSGEMSSGTEYSKLADKERLWNFTSKSAILFVEAGPQLAILWLMIRRMGQLNGFICQEQFYNCGLSGDCNMSDLYAPVPLNSSLIDIAASDVLLALSFAAGMVDVIWTFIAGSALFLQNGAIRLMVLPFLQFTMALLPVLWVVFVDGIIPTGRTSEGEGLIVMGITLAMSLCCVGSVCYFIYYGSQGPIGSKDVENQGL